MDNHIFRSAIGGFNRQDVMEYIERTQKQSEESVAWLESQVEQLQKSESDAQSALQECMRERDELAARLEEMTGRYTKAKGNWETQAQARESSRRDVVQRDKTIREMTEENQNLFHRVQELEADMDDLRQQKLQLAQLELDAHKRAGKVVSEAEDKALKIIEEAEADAKEVLDAARAKAKDIVSDAEGASRTAVHKARIYMEDTVEDFSEILQTFKEVSERITGELKQLDRTVAEFPVGLDGLKKDLDDLCGQISRKDAEAQQTCSETEEAQA